ncbi:hypothetical protein L6164_020610 [Bauhinia variegata]|uniref:Uncharacterized protein n=1 Tax=Bauhinia variegata TaxID=167791 RepID=A0ACB9MVX3_BAUVA|nr:hypothetical protein L6164_020610 [Bauhinia variegata]
MESEDKQVKQKLEVLDILKEAVTIYVKNINFIIFNLLTSLPFFCVMVYFEILLQKTMVETPEILNHLDVYDKYYWHRFERYHFNQNSNDRSFSKDYLPYLIQLGFIYLVPLHVLELCSAAVTMDLASKLRSEENKISLKQMFQKSIGISTMKGTLITSLYMLFLSNCILLAFPWIVNICYMLYMFFGCDIFFAVICCLALAKLLLMYSEWSAIWNMSIVISVLEGAYGVRALGVSYFFSRGNQERGLLLMLVFFTLGLCLRVSCFSFGFYEGGYGIFLQIGLFCVLNTLKWLSCMVYFYDCKERKVEKKVAEEAGKDLESASSKTFSLNTK